MLNFRRVTVGLLLSLILIANVLVEKNNTYRFQDIYFFWCGCTFLLGVSGLYLIKSKKEIRRIPVSLADMAMLLGLYITALHSTQLPTPLLKNQSFRWLLSIFFFVKIFHFLYWQEKEQLNRNDMPIIVGTGIVSIHIFVIGARITSLFRVTSSVPVIEFLSPFPNTGVWGNYLATILPFTVAVMLLPKEQSGNRWYRIMRTTACACTPVFAGLLVMTQARAGWMAASVGVGVVLAFHVLQKQKLSLSAILTRFSFTSKALILFGSMTVVIGTSYAIYLLKPASAFGRILIQKVGLTAFLDHFWTGVGIGRFGSIYGVYQAQYFKNHPTDTQAAWLADDMTYAYNEFINIGTELGIMGLLCLVCLIVVTVQRFIQLQRLSSSHQERYLRLGALASLISFWITGLFSYPMHVLQILIAVAFFFSLLTVPSKEIDTIIQLRTTAVRGFAVVGIVLCSFGGYRLYQEYRACVEWRSLAHDAKMDMFSYQGYNNLYPLLCHHQAFLYNFGSELYYHGHYSEALYYLQQARQYISSSDIFILLGQTSEKLNNYQQAQEYYTTAAFVKPNRIAPHYLLAKLHFANGNVGEAKQAAEKVCSMKMKIENSLGYQMKHEMHDLLQHIP